MRHDGVETVAAGSVLVVVADVGEHRVTGPPEGSQVCGLCHVAVVVNPSGQYFTAVEVEGCRHRVELHKKYIGFVFQQYHLLDNLTVYENIETPLTYRDYSRGERQAMVGDILDKFQIVGKKDLFPSQLSGGQQQLVGVARAVVAKPKLILADEPTGNLHSAQAREIMELFSQLNREGTTIVQVTHSEENARFGHRIIQLKDGWVVGE